MSRMEISFTDEVVGLREVEIFKHPGVGVDHALVPPVYELQALREQLGRVHGSSAIFTLISHATRESEKAGVG